MAFVEIGTGGHVAALLGNAAWLVFGELLAPDGHDAQAHHGAEAFAGRVREVSGADVGLAVRVRGAPATRPSRVAVALGDGSVTQVTRTAFLGGEMGRRRAALIAAAELWKRLGETSAGLSMPPRRPG